MFFLSCDDLEQDGASCNPHIFRASRRTRTHPVLPNLERQPQENPCNSLRINILHISLTGSIFYAAFRLSPPVFSIFYEHGGGGYLCALEPNLEVGDEVACVFNPYREPDRGWRNPEQFQALRAQSNVGRQHWVR